MQSRLNNNGQTLVLFLFFLPIFFVLFLVIYQIGTTRLEKNKIEDSVRQAMIYGFDNMDNLNVADTMKEMIITEVPTLESDNIQIEMRNGKYAITITRKYQILFIFDNELEIRFIGEMKNNKLDMMEDRG